MTYAPATLRTLSAYLKSQDVPVLGIVGNPKTHTRGYHLGADRLKAGDYSAITARDRKGLTNAAAAIDIGRHARLIALGRHLLALKPSDARELIAERADGSHVWRWDDRTGQTTGQPASDELYHHLHISYYRDSEKRDKTAPFRAFYEGLPDTSTEDIVYSIPESDGPYPATVKAGTSLYGSPTDTTANATLNDPSRPYMVVGSGKATDTATTGRRALHGRYSGKPVALGWVDVGRLVR